MGAVKTLPLAVKKPYGTAKRQVSAPTFGGMAVIAFVLLTIACFALFGVVQKALES